MYKIFREINVPSAGIIKPPGFDVISRVYREQISRIVEYYNINSKMLDNKHILIRILNIATPDISLPIEDFVRLVYSRVNNLARHFKLTNEGSYGELHKDVFYRGYNILLHREDSINIGKLVNKWKNGVPVIVHKHPISSLQFLLPDVYRYPTIEEGLSVVSIDIAKMMIMYREYLRDQLRLPEGIRGGANQFVSRYVLPNMLYTHSNICIYNRLSNLHYSETNVNKEYSKHPMLVVDYSNKVDSVLSYLLRYMDNRGMYYSDIVKTIPHIYDLETLMMPDIGITRQSWWMLYLSRIYEMKTIIDIGNERGRAMNGSLISDMKIDISRLLNDNVYSRLSNDISYPIYLKLQELLDT